MLLLIVDFFKKNIYIFLLNFLNISVQSEDILQMQGKLSFRIVNCIVADEAANSIANIISSITSLKMFLIENVSGSQYFFVSFSQILQLHKKINLLYYIRKRFLRN
jgi:hypothetical protein